MMIGSYFNFFQQSQNWKPNTGALLIFDHFVLSKNGANIGNLCMETKKKIQC